ncbi:O-acetyl-ADP-ribose deacetylase [Nesterenkonia sp.]|uniref:O-acetyl-ADP-ribose deacetylase n=1 Tax=Nesterenkonia sp. TaxID=704201 RepID=UPI0026353EBE|nr:O-acetyl-ADP-ribose deacetylase [Nesterenkonia sp.]
MTRITVVQGDITAQQVDAVVNAANSSLLGGGGVDGAIHRAAGPELLEECRRLRRTQLPDGLPAGRAVRTGAGRLPARWVIHTVAPNRRAGEHDAGVLRSCFATSLQQARDAGAKTIAFPAIGAGVYGWDPHQVAEAAAAALQQDPALREHFEEIRFVTFNATATQAFSRRFGPGADAQ